ncbi:Holliday junction resolvase RuvX [Pseudoflavonifractor sp. 60]|uniref:Holliday junction resolvase RuvX n=1 Tax=Pseudoflavonifractor sp. 60 TaxID=2304576 RepID=UPI00136CA725|nr:Holliday junction resolvase RuvX [Pseudoflavonifractor sp. 60]NBI69225.1 Holliday junction resolvase RuvX [Pseudoflavonifractor sp. 60]
MRVMAIDYGDAHTGVAISDPTGLLAGTTTTINSRRQETVVDELVKLIEQHRPGEVVLGFPRNMDGTDSRRAELYRGLARALEEAAGMKVILWDERRTTIDAHQILFSQGKNGRKRKKLVDAVAASLILENYLNYKRLKGDAPQ